MSHIADYCQRQAEDRYKVCCFGDTPDYHWFHSDDFTNCYPQDAESHEPQVCAEVQARFYEDCVKFAYIFDNDVYSDAWEYESLVYPEKITIATMGQFWTEFERMIELASLAMWDNDILSCPICGYHYHATEICDCEEESA